MYSMYDSLKLSGASSSALQIGENDSASFREGKMSPERAAKYTHGPCDSGYIAINIAITIRMRAHSESNFQAVAKFGAEAYIPFRSGTTGRIGGLFAKAFHFFSLYREEFLKHYHRRSNVESAIMAIKTKFGDHVRSKTDVAMKNEVLCKILAHNVCCLISAMHELGVTPAFDAPCTKTLALAQ